MKSWPVVTERTAVRTGTVGGAYTLVALTTPVWPFLLSPCKEEKGGKRERRGREWANNREKERRVGHTKDWKCCGYANDE